MDAHNHHSEPTTHIAQDNLPTPPCPCAVCTFKKYAKRGAIFLILASLGYGLNYYLKTNNTPNPANKNQIEINPRVAVGEVSTEDVPVYLTALGSVGASSSVTIRSQINGILTKVLFTAGQIVDAEQVIAEIDPRPYEAQLSQMEGQLTRDRALLHNAQVDLERYQKLIKQDSISQQTLDTQTALVKQYEGNVASDLGQIEAARLNLDYCYIKSPIRGRAGLQLVDAGNLIQTSDLKGIVTINATQPVNVTFAIPEEQLTRIAKKMSSHEELLVNIQDRNQNELLATGKLTTMDNQIDASTGTIKLQAEVPNEDDLLFPNQFVNVQLLIETLPQALVVPTQAIRHGVNGNFVYLLNADNTVSIKEVKTQIAYQTKTVIESDLKSGQKVIIEGADQLKDGMKVTVLDEGLPKA